MQRHPDNRVDPKTELGDNGKDKCTTNQLVPPGYGIYPVIWKPQDPSSKEIHSDREEMTKPYHNRCLGKNGDENSVDDRQPSGVSAAVELLNVVRIDSRGTGRKWKRTTAGRLVSMVSQWDCGQSPTDSV